MKLWKSLLADVMHSPCYNFIGILVNNKIALEKYLRAYNTSAVQYINVLQPETSKHYFVNKSLNKLYCSIPDLLKIKFFNNKFQQLYLKYIYISTYTGWIHGFSKIPPYFPLKNFPVRNKENTAESTLRFPLGYTDLENFRVYTAFFWRLG